MKRSRSIGAIAGSYDGAAATFNEIYRTNAWGDTETRSGPGSSLEQTAGIRTSLPALLARLGARTMLDLPCGDLMWLDDLDLDLHHYIGADIVPDLIESNRARAVGRPGAPRSFVCLDITRDELPEVDVVLCRDCLVHLPNAACLDALRNVRASGSTWLLTTHYPHRHTNADIAIGRHRAIDLEGAPFHLPRPREVLVEGCTEPVDDAALKSLALWACADLPESR